MCGIAGYVAVAGTPFAEERVLRRMTRLLDHRGPDDEGFYFQNGVALGHRRLSIIDLEGGRQPMCTHDGRLWVTYNGEVYNYPELRMELIGKGYAFQTRSDTEVILHLYAEYGGDCLKRMNGMYAFAVWDSRERKLFLARDRMGVKPLHYYLCPDGLIFASELKAILVHPLVQRQIDLAALNKYLTFEYIPAPHTIFKGIKKLPPGHYLDWKDGHSSVASYWDVPMADDPPDSRSEEEYREELLSLLQAAVRRRLLSDVPVGVFLSGGIDSSLVTAMATKEAAAPVQTFSIGFTDPSFDESAYAEEAARACGTEHHHRMMELTDVLSLVPRIAELLDEPMADASVLPTYLLSGFAAKHVKVVLGGDGGDELFAGYPTYQAHRLAKYFSALPRQVWTALGSAASKLPISHRNISLDFKIKQFLKGMGLPPEIRYFHWMGSFLQEEKQALFLPDVRNALMADDPYEDLDAYVSRSGLTDDFQRLLYLSLKLYLQDDILVKVDRASMANSLEVRAPFLDYQVVEFAARLPLRYKLKGLQTKYLLKRAADGLVPRRIIRRPKKGFGIPLSRWLNNELQPLLNEYFSEDRLKRKGFFRPEYIRRLVEEHKRRVCDHRKLLWTLLVFEMWHEHYGSA